MDGDLHVGGRSPSLSLVDEVDDNGGAISWVGGLHPSLLFPTFTQEIHILNGTPRSLAEEPRICCKRRRAPARYRSVGRCSGPER